MGQRRIGTNNVHPDDLSISLLDLFQLSISYVRATVPSEQATYQTYRRKYQNRDLATTSLGAKMRMRYILGLGSLSVGRWRPTT